jgi:hypothetical protein
VTPLGEEAVEVDAQGAAAVQHGGREPRLAAPLDALLQGPLQLVLLRARARSERRRQEARAAERRLDLADALEIFRRVEPRGEVPGQLDLPLDQFGVAARAEMFKRHPDLERVEAARAELAVAEEVVLHVGAAALLAEVLGRDVEGVAQDAPAPAHEQRAAGEGHEEPLVRVDGDGVGALDAAQAPAVLLREGEPAAVGRVHVEPEFELAREVGQLV